jgi:hypothetical protein
MIVDETTPVLPVVYVVYLEKYSDNDGIIHQQLCLVKYKMVCKLWWSDLKLDMKLYEGNWSCKINITEKLFSANDTQTQHMLNIPCRRVKSHINNNYNTYNNDTISPRSNSKFLTGHLFKNT